MAEIQSPISGGLRVARRTISADAFVRASAPPPAVAQPDPVTTSLIQRNSLALNTVSQQLSSLSQQVNSLNAAMQNVYGNITQGAALERRKDAQEQEQERRLAEQQLREGKESIIERKIQSALVYPVQKIAAKSSFTLSRLMQFFTTLLGGWLLNQGLETIKALGEGNKKRLEEIKNNVLKNLGIIGGVYAGIRFGLTSLFNVTTRLAARIASAVAVGLFLKPVQALLDGVKGAANKLIPKIQNTLPNFSGGKSGSGGGSGGGKPDGKNPPAGPARTPGEASKRVGQKGANRFSPSSLLGPIIGGLTGGTIDTMQGEDPAKAYTTNLGGAAVASYAAGLVSKLPLPPIIKIPATLATGFFSYGPATDMLKGFYESGEKMFTGGSDTEPVNTSAQPTQNKIPDIAFNSNKENLANTESTKTTDVTQISKEFDVKSPPLYGTIEADQIASEIKKQVTLEKDTNLMAETLSSKPLMASESVTMADNAPLKPLEAQIMPIKKEASMVAQSVGPLPEPTPTIIPLPLGGGNKASGSKIVSGGTQEPIPTISAENFNNFYLMFAHREYNVPIG